MMDKSIFIKQLMYRSFNRGCKETDLILGNFAKENLLDFNEEELNFFSQILAEPDLDIYDYLTNKQIIPQRLNNSVMKKLQEYKLYN
jgi:antitoxin CptB